MTNTMVALNYALKNVKMGKLKAIRALCIYQQLSLLEGSHAGAV